MPAAVRGGVFVATRKSAVLETGNTRTLKLRHSLDKPDVRFWLRQLAQDDTEAFWELWAIHQRQLFFICLRFMGNAHADAEDALSQIRERARDIFPQAAASLRNPKAWLVRVAVNQCIDIQRVRQRHERRTVHLDTALFGDVCAAVAREAPPGQSLVLSELKAAVERAIRMLPARMRAAAVLYFLEERSHQETAAALNISYANARKRIQEARTILKTSVDYREHLSFFEVTL
ncbi:MAG TPA: sigma-70 family RNA polymerase sigma factor [Verrucomicrobiae bacterium]